MPQQMKFVKHTTNEIFNFIYHTLFGFLTNFLYIIILLNN